MSFSPPNTFVDGTVCTSADLEGNYQSLRVYLHKGIVPGDVEAAQWIDTRHIQPPSVEPYSGVQHGVSGHQGGNDLGHGAPDVLHQVPERAGAQQLAGIPCHPRHCHHC